MYTTAVSNCLISALLAKLHHPLAVRIVKQPVAESSHSWVPYPPHFLWIYNGLIYDFFPGYDDESDPHPIMCWLPYRGHIRVRSLATYKIYHPERTDL